mgnify:CR=1 FL=1
MITFLKGLIVGIGGIAPGLSGSVLLVIFGLYQKTINAIATLFKDFKKNILLSYYLKKLFYHLKIFCANSVRYTRQLRQMCPPSVSR